MSETRPTACVEGPSKLTRPRAMIERVNVAREVRIQVRVPTKHERTEIFARQLSSDERQYIATGASNWRR